MKRIISAIIGITLLACLCGCTVTEPEEVTAEFFQGLKTKNMEVLNRYMDDEHINILINSKGSQKDVDRIYKNIMKNFSYRIIKVEEGEKETKIQMELSNVSFKKVMNAYQKKSYAYMTDHLYENKLSKKELNKKCLDIYADQVAETAQNGKVRKTKMTVILEKNDNYGWDIQVTNKLMETIVGQLSSPL
ncbi:MAG: hypothetical protein RSD88_03510 [Anaerovoracaceae bacterium]